jgi:hypothetical protein
MPVQIKDLVIVAHLTDEGGKKDTGTADPSKSSGKTSLSEEVKMQLVEETVQQVLEILERQKDR